MIMYKKSEFPTAFWFAAKPCARSVSEIAIIFLKKKIIINKSIGGTNKKGRAYYIEYLNHIYRMLYQKGKK